MTTPTSVTLPSHPQRIALHNEVHARPPQAMQAPLMLTHLVLVCDAAQRAASRQHLNQLLRDHHQPSADDDASHLRADLGTFQLRWELHTEFVTWTFHAPLNLLREDGAALPTARDLVPQAWLAGLPGVMLSGLHVWVVGEFSSVPPLAPQVLLREDTLVAARVSDGGAEVHTDFALHADGFGRLLLTVRALTPRRLGRLVQRLLEIETYRMTALLGLPVARAAAPLLAQAEQELSELAGAIRSARADEEPQLLDRLTRLAGLVESHHAATHARFSASAAYFELMDQRIVAIREQALPGMQTVGQFVERRLTPARNTCDWVTRRQSALSQRIARISNLLRTRVEIEQQQSSQALLATMTHRQELQLKLQATVEGLSVAAITYYIVGLISYLAKGLGKLGWPWSAEATAAVSIPLVALAVWWSLRRLHRSLFQHP